jgi:hypothetical protein
LPPRTIRTAISTSRTLRVTPRSSRATESIQSKERAYELRRRGADSNRCMCARRSFLGTRRERPRWNASSSNARVAGRGACCVCSDAGARAASSFSSSPRSDGAARARSVSAWSTCRATTAACTSDGRRRPSGSVSDNQCESLPPGRQRAPHWKARAPTACAGKVVTDRCKARAESKPPTRSRSLEGRVKGNGGRTGHTAEG